MRFPAVLSRIRASGVLATRNASACTPPFFRRSHFCRSRRGTQAFHSELREQVVARFRFLSNIADKGSNRPIIWLVGAAEKLHGSVALYILWAGLHARDMLRKTAGHVLCSTVRLFAPKHRAS